MRGRALIDLRPEWWVVQEIARPAERTKEWVQLAARRGWHEVEVDGVTLIVEPIECYTGEGAERRAIDRMTEEAARRKGPCRVLMMTEV